MNEFPTAVSVKGSVAESVREKAREKFGGLPARCREPIRSIEVRLISEENPSRERPAIVEAVADLDGEPVRVHVAATRMSEALDLAFDRIVRRVEKAEARRHRLPERHNTGHPQENQWRHGDLPTKRLPYHPRPVDEREIVRRKSFALDPISLDEAAFDLEQLDHDFYLFTDLQSGSDCVISRDSHGFACQYVGPNMPNTLGCAAPVHITAQHVPTASLVEAEERLDVTDEPFVFFRSEETGRGNVLYRRRDGHYGLIMPA